LRTITRDPKTARIEHRVAGADCNVYYALAAMLAGGVAGLEEQLEPPEQFNKIAWGVPESAAPHLPTGMAAAVDALLKDKRLSQHLGEELVSYWAGSRKWESWAFNHKGGDPDRVTEFERRRYFEHV
jgi:glutamine synthetase